MVKTLTKIGNSHGIVFDSAIMELARLQPGAQVNLEIHQGGTITITPIRPRLSRGEKDEVIDRVMKKFSRTMKNLA